jgi:hypothetical protein
MNAKYRINKQKKIIIKRIKNQHIYFTKIFKLISLNFNAMIKVNHNINI